MVLLTLLNMDMFLWADVWTNGCCSHAHIFNDGQLKQSIMDVTIGFPDAEPLPGDDTDMPYFIVADDTLALRTWLMKPFSGRNLNDQQHIFNYRLSRARLVVQNVFGVLANRFRSLLTTMDMEPNNITSKVLVCMTVHNIIRKCYQADHQGVFHVLLQKCCCGSSMAE